MGICKYPGKLSERGYFDKMLNDYNNPHNICKEEFSCLASCILKSIGAVIANSENDSSEMLNCLLSLPGLTDDKIQEINTMDSNLFIPFNKIVLAFKNPNGFIRLVANNYKIEIKPDVIEHCVEFVKVITPKCIKEIVEANQVKPKTDKKVTFADDNLDEDKENKAITADKKSFYIEVVNEAKQEPTEKVTLAPKPGR